MQCCIIALKELQKHKIQCEILGHKINIAFAIMILQYPHLKHKMLAGFFGWFVQYPNVGHKICMFNDKNDDDKKIEIRRNKIIVMNNRRK